MIAAHGIPANHLDVVCRSESGSVKTTPKLESSVLSFARFAAEAEEGGALRGVAMDVV